MVTAGIDVGAKTVKVMILCEAEVLAHGSGATGFDQVASTGAVLEDALCKAGLSAGDLQKVVATGAGGKRVPMADRTISEVAADARGAIFLFPGARTVVDVGAEEGRAIKCDPQGRALDFAVNEKCAAGAGAFTEAMARALEVDLEEFGQLSLRSTQTIPMNAQCTVFAESEVVSLLHAQTPKEDIARAVHDAIASRIAGLARRVGVEMEMVVIGGVARNAGFVDALERALDFSLLVPELPDMVGALGAALVAGD